MQAEWIVSVALGLGLSASAGFRVFIPLLVAAIAGKMGILPLAEEFSWMSGWPAIICFGTATLAEIIAYYIPLFDNLIDTINTPLAILAGTLLATSVLPVDSELLKWVFGFLVGGGSAGIIHTGTALLRLASTKTTAGTANPVLSTGEHIAAAGTSLASLFVPLFTAIVVLGLLVLILSRFLRTRKNS
jgi:hypothetical protein